MILARITTAVREQNWVAVVLEFLIVLSGVVIGFQITAWNEVRDEHQREALILERLRADFQAITERTQTDIASLEARDGYAAAFVSMLHDADPDVDDRTFLIALSNAIGTPPPHGRSATYVELLASGEMRLVRSEDLRTALVEFDEQVRQHELAYETLATMVIDNAGILLTLQAMELAARPDMLPAYADERMRLRNSPDLLVAAQLMQTVSRINLARTRVTMQRAEEVLAALE